MYISLTENQFFVKIKIIKFRTADSIYLLLLHNLDVFNYIQFPVVDMDLHQHFLRVHMKNDFHDNKAV